jgi:DNA topoisomerase-2
MASGGTSSGESSGGQLTGGRHGYGAKLTNIFSTKFVVETVDKKQKKKYTQTWLNNMDKSGDAIIERLAGASLADASDYTKITFTPDLDRFGLDPAKGLPAYITAQMHKRVLDVAACTPGLEVTYNGAKVPVTSFEDYVNLHLAAETPGSEEAADGAAAPIVFSRINARWEIAVTTSPQGQFEQVSFVNGIHTARGGTHVDAFLDPLVKRLTENIKRRIGSADSGTMVREKQVKNHMMVFVNCLVENPSFDSQVLCIACCVLCVVLLYCCIVVCSVIYAVERKVSN